MSKLIETEKKLRKEYDELAAKCKFMEQKLKEAHSKKEKLITKVNALEDQILTQQSLLDNDKKETKIIRKENRFRFFINSPNK